MKLLILLFLVGFVSCAPVDDEDTSAENSKEEDELTLTEDYFIDRYVIYTGEHDIVRIHVPLNGLTSITDNGLVLFFVEADIKDDGKNDYKGLYILKDKKATKLLNNGRDTTTTGISEDVYFGATDGIYKYNSEKNTAEKYGTVTDNIKAIEMINDDPIFLILTEDGKLHIVTKGGTRKEIIEDIPHAHEICLDYSKNLFYYGHDKVPHVKTQGGIKKIEGLPENPEYVRLVRPPFIYSEGVVFISDDKPYIIYPNGTSEMTDYNLEVEPTAFAPEAALLHYYGHNKKIYKLNALVITLVAEIKNILNTFDDVMTTKLNSNNKDVVMKTAKAWLETLFTFIALFGQ